MKDAIFEGKEGMMEEGEGRGKENGKEQDGAGGRDRDEVHQNAWSRK